METTIRGKLLGIDKIVEVKFPQFNFKIQAVDGSIHVLSLTIFGDEPTPTLEAKNKMIALPVGSEVECSFFTRGIFKNLLSIAPVEQKPELHEEISSGETPHATLPLEVSFKERCFHYACILMNGRLYSFTRKVKNDEILDLTFELAEKIEKRLLGKNNGG